MYWLARPSTIKPLHHPPKLLTSPTVLLVLPPRLRPPPPALHRVVLPEEGWGAVSRGSPDPGGAGGGFPRLNLPRLSSPPSPTPMAERVSSGPSAHSHRLGRPRALRSEGIHSPPAPAGLQAEHRLRSRRLRGLRTSVSVSASAGAGRCARRPAGSVRGVCLWRGRCVCEPPPGARRPRRPPRASAPPGPAPGRGLERSVRQGPRPRAVRRPRHPRPRPRPPQASPQRDPSRPLSRLDAAADTRTLTDTRPPGRGRAGLRRCQPRPRRRLSPEHALAPGPLTLREPGPTAAPGAFNSWRQTYGGASRPRCAAPPSARPKTPAAPGLPVPSSGTPPPPLPTPHPQQPAPRSPVLCSTPGNWRSVAGAFPFYRQDN